MKNRSLAVTVLMLSMMVVLAGCKHHHHRPPQKPLPTSLPAPVVEMRQQTLTPPPTHLPVKQGQSPLAWMIDTGGLVQIVDADSSALVAQGVASPRSIVSIDDNAGIRISGQLIVKGPLTPGRTYQIFVNNSGGADNVWRTEVVKPGINK